MKIVRPDKNEPIVLHSPRLSIATILVRFVIFLTLAVAVLTLAWLK